MKNNIQLIRQLSSSDCGVACSNMVLSYFGIKSSYTELTSILEVGKDGTSLESLTRLFNKHKLNCSYKYESLENIKLAPNRCVILMLHENHFVVLNNISSKRFKWLPGTDVEYEVLDPAVGKLVYSKLELLSKWIRYRENHNTNNEKNGILLIVETQEEYSTKPNTNAAQPGVSAISYFKFYIKKYRILYLLIFLGVILGSVIQIVLVYLTKQIVDYVVPTKDISMMYTIIAAQIMFIFGKAAIDVCRNWLQLQLSIRINIYTLTSFFATLFKLPISYFENRSVSDLLQRITDHKRIERFLSASLIGGYYSMINLILFFGVILMFNTTLFIGYTFGVAVYAIWMILFIKKRKQVDYRKFMSQVEEQSKTLEILYGINEIKLNGAEGKFKRNWEKSKVNVFHTSVDSLSLDQRQGVGAGVLTDLTNTTLIAFSISLVIGDAMTVGGLLMITFILGSINSHLIALIGVSKDLQDAFLAYERIEHVKQTPHEDLPTKITDIETMSRSIEFNDVNFRYPGSEINVLQNVSITIPPKSTTAIVGASGSGKTTLLKCLLKYYVPTSGEIRLGDINLSDISARSWRSKCGVVMQDYKIFNDTLLNNIIMNDETIDQDRLNTAVYIANIKDLISQFPAGWHTNIGENGQNLSRGQEQRICIARAIYKYPEILLMDEATAALDTQTEKEISARIKDYTLNRTTIIIAHRLSTVMQADQIIVIDSGSVKEIGTHYELLNQKGYYYNLVKNQLVLDEIRK